MFVFIKNKESYRLVIVFEILRKNNNHINMMVKLLYIDISEFGILRNFYKWNIFNELFRFYSLSFVYTINKMIKFL